jgi:hypothetical protein
MKAGVFLRYWKGIRVTENRFYICEKFYPFLYVEIESARRAYILNLRAPNGVPDAAARSEHNGQMYWRNRTNGIVHGTKPNEPIFLIEETVEEFKHQTDTIVAKFWHVIIGDKVGWIIVQDWLEIKPLRKDNAK